MRLLMFLMVKKGQELILSVFLYPLVNSCPKEMCLYTQMRHGYKVLLG